MGLKLCFLFILLACASYAQRIDNLTTVLAGEHIEITFDLIDDAGGQTFDVQLFSSHNNYTTPLLYVSGGVPIWAIAGIVVVGGVVGVLVSDPPGGGNETMDIPDPIKPGGG